MWPWTHEIKPFCLAMRNVPTTIYTRATYVLGGWQRLAAPRRGAKQLPANHTFRSAPPGGDPMRTL